LIPIRIPVAAQKTHLSTVAIRRLPMRPPGRIIPNQVRVCVAMHKVSIPQAVIERVKARHGREHVHEDFDPAKTALVVVDMQNAFMLPGVAHAPCLMAQQIVPNINRLAKAMREAGGTVVWIKTAYTDDTLENWSTLYEMLGPGGTGRRATALARGSKGYEIWPELEVLDQDLIVEKNRYSAFIQGSSDLAEVLRARGLDTVLITGTVTNVCCESTARDAMMLNFKTVMITDGNAAVTDEDHNASLIGFYLIFGDIMSTDFAIECLKRNAQKGLAAAE
jgi:ureidoacrylate peracid hydrolase